ncbi:MAG: DUF2336 domain-containing protein [Salinarimonas sp.]
MHALYELVRELERGSDAGSMDRDEVLDRFTRLFAARERRLLDPELALFDRVFVQLAEEAGAEARVALATTLAESGRAPAAILDRLVQDRDPAVAVPVLERAIDVHVQTLVTLARTYPERHQLAIARRAAIEAPVSRALAESGTDAVLRTLASNSGARIDDESFALLAARARKDSTLIGALCVRSDTPDRHHADLLAMDFAAICEAFDREYGALELLGVDIVPIVVSAMVDESRGVFAASALTASIAYVTWRIDCGAFQLRHIDRWLERRQIEDVVAALALLSGIPAEFVQRLCFAASPIPAAMLFKALGLPFTTLKAFLHHHDPDLLGIDEQVEVYDVFDTISADVAVGIVRHAALCVRIDIEL